MLPKDNIFDKKGDIMQTIYTYYISVQFSVLLFPGDDHLYGYQVIAILLLCDKLIRSCFVFLFF